MIGAIATMTIALATAFFVMGVEKTRQFCERRREIGAVLLAGDSPDPLSVHTFNCTLQKED